MRKTRNVVAMPLMPSAKECGSVVRADLRYAKYGEATWRWWCNKNDVEFVTIDSPLGSGIFQEMSPSQRRWLAPQNIFREFGQDISLALVDADTMIRWDAPNLFDAANEEFSAVRGKNARWIYHDIRAYQGLFPDVTLPWWDYFNAGMVVLRQHHLQLIDAFLSVLTSQWAAIDLIGRTQRVSTDQTLLNFVCKREQATINFMPEAFNTLHCFPWSALLDEIERARELAPDVPDELFAPADTFDFVQYGYIWHFTNVVSTRYAVMRETWHRYRHFYPGASPEA